MSVKLVGMIWLFLLAHLICNVMEGESYIVTADNQAELMEISEYSQTTTQDADTGGVWTIIEKAWDFISKLVFWDYSIFYDIDPVTGVQTANDFVIIRLFLMSMGVALLIWVYQITLGKGST